jgi:hypothetical protein
MGKQAKANSGVGGFASFLLRSGQHIDSVDERSGRDEEENRFGNCGFRIFIDKQPGPIVAAGRK